MAQYYLVGNLETDDDLWLVDGKDGKATPVPRAVWEDVISMFQAQAVSAAAADHETRKDLAANILAAVEGGVAANRSVRLSLSANELGNILVTARLAPIERVMEQEEGLASALRGFVTVDIGGS